MATSQRWVVATGLLIVSLVVSLGFNILQLRRDADEKVEMRTALTDAEHRIEQLSFWTFGRAELPNLRVLQVHMESREEPPRLTGVIPQKLSEAESWVTNQLGSSAKILQFKEIHAVDGVWDFALAFDTPVVAYMPKPNTIVRQTFKVWPCRLGNRSSMTVGLLVPPIYHTGVKEEIDRTTSLAPQSPQVIKGGQEAVVISALNGREQGSTLTLACFAGAPPDPMGLPGIATTRNGPGARPR